MSVGSSELFIRIVHCGLRTSIRLEGELDLSNKSVLRSHLDYVIIDAPGDVEMDLGAVSYVDSSGLAEVLDAYSRLLDLGRELRVVKASRQVARLFEICGITHLLAESAPPLAPSLTIATAFPAADATARLDPTVGSRRAAS